MDRNVKPALGFTNTVDYEIDWSSISFNSLISELDIHRSDIKQNKDACSMKELLSTMLFYMEKNEGCGMFIGSVEPLYEIIKRSSYSISLGGTAVRAALILSEQGYACDLAISANNKETRELLPENCRTWCASESDYDSPHVVIQYPAGFKVEGPEFSFTTTRPNRLIFTADISNSNLKISDKFWSCIKESPILVLSSLELIENTTLLKNILEEITDFLKTYKGIIFYEDAFFKISKHAEIVNSALSNYDHIHSMNEDEFSSYLGEKAKLSDPDFMHNALSKVQNRIQSSLLLLHTAQYALLYGKDCNEYYEALQKGILFASARFAYGDNLTPQKLETILKCETNNNIQLFTKQIMSNADCVCIPSYDINTESPTTIGLGDTFVGGFLVGLLDSKKRRS